MQLEVCMAGTVILSIISPSGSILMTPEPPQSAAHTKPFESTVIPSGAPSLEC